MWTTDGDNKTTSRTVEMKNIDSMIPDDVEKKWDEELKQNYIEYTEGANKKQMWIEDIDSLKAKISLINQNNLAGIASWKKDMESDGVWELFKQELNLN